MNVFASKSSCFKCGTMKDGSKGTGKGGPADAPPPDKFSTELWEEPRKDTGLRLIEELCPPGFANWSYAVRDESRRSYAAYLQCPFRREQCSSFFQDIRSQTDWKQPDGPLGPVPRKTAWMVAKGCTCTYRYGRIEVDPQEFPPWMIQVMHTVMPYFGLTDPGDWPNSCNLNLYEDGGMSVGWHSDDERLFQGKFNDIRILSLSLGVTRRFELRSNWPEPRERQPRPIMLGDGDLCSMEGMTQKHYQHRVPKEGNIEGERINLTWRWTVKHCPNCPAGRRRR